MTVRKMKRIPVNDRRTTGLAAGLLTGLLLAAGSLLAQDTTRKKEVNITSTFKPTLKEAAKININPAPPPADTARPRLQYNIPNQNLAFQFQPGTLKPLALQVDSGGKWDNDSYVKVGYGTYKTPFVQTGITIGDGKVMGLNFYGKHFSSEGDLPFQKVMQTRVDVAGYYKSAGNLEWNARVGGEQNRYNRYGYQPTTLNFPEDSLKIRYQSWRGRLGVRNINRTDLGISFAPEVRFEGFSDAVSNSESSFYFNLPLRKTIGTHFEADLALEANLSQYRPSAKNDVSNNYFVLAPSVLYKSGNLFVQAGIKPSWDNGTLRIFPNLSADVATNDKRFSVQAGWIGYLRNAGFQYLANFNPYILAPSTVYNTQVVERFGGFKGSAGDHLSYAAKIAYNTYNNQPLFTNDTVTGRSFIVVNEPEMNMLNIGGELGFNVGEKFSILTNLQLNNYNTKLNDRAWGLLPFEVSTTVRLQVIKDLTAHATLYAFDGGRAYGKGGEIRMPAATDVSAGLEFKIVDHVKLWAQFNNILNQNLQRWNQYPSFGFNFLGGVVFSLAQKN